MKLFLFILLLAAFLQTSFVPLNLCLLILISRSYAIHQRNNYYLAFFAGILIGLLNTANLGVWPIIFTAVVFLCHLIRQLPVMNRNLAVIPLTLVLVLVINGLEQLIFHTPFNWVIAIVSAVVSLPLFFVIKEWEERFIAKPGLKLKYN